MLAGEIYCYKMMDHERVVKLNLVKKGALTTNRKNVMSSAVPYPWAHSVFFRARRDLSKEHFMMHIEEAHHFVVDCKRVLKQSGRNGNHDLCDDGYRGLNRYCFHNWHVVNELMKRYRGSEAECHNILVDSNWDLEESLKKLRRSAMCFRLIY